MAKRFQKVYLEITNICNLQCAFCPGTRRAPVFMEPAAFARAAAQVRAYTDYIYLHLMGEPLLHPQLDRLLAISAEQGLRVNLTTNGVCIGQAGQTLLASPAVRKVAFSLHAFEANSLPETLDNYLTPILAFCDAARARGIFCELRLWNGDAGERTGENALNEQIRARLRAHFGTETSGRRQGCFTLADGVFLVLAEIFDWPDATASPGGDTVFCHGLRDQIGVLADGTVVPCCLDSEGTLALGNLLRQPLAEILDGARAKRIYAGFSARTAAEPLCARCGYARRFG